MVTGMSGTGGVEGPRTPPKTSVGEGKTSSTPSPEDKISAVVAKTLSGSNPAAHGGAPGGGLEALRARSPIVREALGLTSTTLEETRSAVRDSTLPTDVKGAAEGVLASANRFIEALTSKVLHASGSMAYGVALTASLVHDFANFIRRLCQLPERDRTELTLITQQFRELGNRLQGAANRLPAASTDESLLLQLDIAYQLAAAKMPLKDSSS